MFKKFSQKFWNDESGTATIESLLWMPIFFFLFVLITNASFIFFGKAQALKIIQDGNRAFAVGRILTAAEAQEKILEKLILVAPGAEVTTEDDNFIITTNATFSAIDLMPVKLAPNFTNLKITITSEHFKEDYP